MFFLGLLGLLQMTVLPGWVWIRAARIRTRNQCEEALYCFAASLILNHLLVYFLVATGQNNRGVWLAIAAVEAVLLVFLSRPWTLPRYVAVPPAEVTRGAPPLTSVALAALAAVTLLAFVPILVGNWGTVFISNDDVVSWDRWAQDWFLNRFPLVTDLYPQLLPANWSVTYALMRTAEVKMFAKAIMPFFAVAILLLFVSLAWNRKDRVYLAGCSIAGFLFLQYLGKDFLATGYADVALAFFCFLAFYVLYQEGSAPPAEARFLSLFFAAGAALAKQGGLLVLAAIGLYFLAAKRKDNRESIATPALRWSAGLAIAFVVLWYVPKFYSAVQGGSNLRFLVHDIHEGRNYAERLWFGCRLLMKAGGRPGVPLFWVVAALTLGGLLFTETRRVTGRIVLPTFLLWGAFFSYEIRTLALLLPFIALVCCLTLKRIGNYVFNKLKLPAPLRGPMPYWATAILLLVTGVLLYYSGEAVPRMRVNYTWPMILVGACMIVVPMVQVSRGLRIEVSLPALASGLTLLIGLVVWPTYPDGQIVEQQRSAQRLIGKPAVNARLYRLHDGGQLNQPVLSNYFYLNYLPELSSLNRLIQCGECSVPALLRDIAVTSDAGFILLEDGFLPARTVHRIGHCPGIETVFVEGTVRLLHVDRRQLDETCFIDPETIRPLIEKLYPSETSVGRGFNVQPDGSSALGVACRNGSRTNVIVWAGTQLDSVYGASTALTAQVPARLYAKPGHYPIEILDKDSGLRSPAVNFEVK